MISPLDERGAPESGSAQVAIVIPCRAEYVAVGRLAILGVASRLAYSYDEVEDIRLAVGEACTHAVERAYSAELPSGLLPTIWIESDISASGLKIAVRDNIPPGSVAIPVADTSEDELSCDKLDLGAALIEILVDEVSVETLAEGTVMHLHKRAPQEQDSVGEIV